MARPLRIEYPGALYHVTSRGNGRADIFLDDQDRLTFLDILGDAAGRFGWRCHAYCLMDNHYHLLIETPEANLSRGMRHVNGVYTQRFNRAHELVGHVFQGRFKAILVEREAYLLELSRYVVLNPVRAGLVRSAKDWRWSSYRATAGLKKGPNFLHTKWILGQFGKGDRGRTEYRRFITAGKGASPWEDLRQQIYMGGSNFIERVVAEYGGAADAGEVPRVQRRPPAKTLAEYAADGVDRNAAIRAAWRSGAYTLSEIATHFGLHYSWVSRIARTPKKKAKDKT